MTASTDQRVVLLNLAHVARSPQRWEGAAARILGIFQDLESLTRHAKQHYGDGVDVIAIPVRKWAAVLRNTLGGDEIKHLEKLGSAYKAREKRHEEEFRTNVSEQRTGAVRRDLASDAEPQARGGVTAAAPEAPQRAEAPGVPRDAELRLQRYAVISVLPDVEEEDVRMQEPALLVWDAFDSEDEAREKIKNELAIVARDVHLDTVTMYEWIPLTGIDVSRIKEEFRDESLTDIIQARKDESRQVENYRTLCEQRGQTPNILDLGADPLADPQRTVPPPLEQQEPLPNLLESTPPIAEGDRLETGGCAARPLAAVEEDDRLEPGDCAA
jgi:hypothetical protein